MHKFYNLIPGSPGEESRLYIDGEITAGEDYTDWWTASRTKGAQSFRRELSQCGPVTVYINSPGGDVFAGAAMYSALLDHPHKVTVKIMGIAASAASVVAMAGDEVLISPVGYMMIHDPWAVAVGNARDMEHEAQVLREIGDGILAAYQKKTGMEESKLKALLAAETYMNAQSAIEMGFCDGLWDDREPAAHAETSAPAATMQGRNYTPAAYMAKLRNERTESRVQSTENQVRFNDCIMVSPSQIQLNATDAALRSPKDPRIAQALALVKDATALVSKA